MEEGIQPRSAASAIMNKANRYATPAINSIHNSNVMATPIRGPGDQTDQTEPKQVREIPNARHRCPPMRKWRQEQKHPEKKQQHDAVDASAVAVVGIERHCISLAGVV